MRQKHILLGTADLSLFSGYTTFQESEATNSISRCELFLVEHCSSAHCRDGRSHQQVPPFLLVVQKTKLL